MQVNNGHQASLDIARLGTFPCGVAPANSGDRAAHGCTEVVAWMTGARTRTLRPGDVVTLDGTRRAVRHSAPSPYVKGMALAWLAAPEVPAGAPAQ